MSIQSIQPQAVTYKLSDLFDYVTAVKAQADADVVEVAKVKKSQGWDGTWATKASLAKPLGALLEQIDEWKSQGVETVSMPEAISASMPPDHGKVAILYNQGKITPVMKPE